MRRFGMVAYVALLAISLSIAAPKVYAKSSAPVRAVVIDFLHQFIDCATPADMPMESRIKTGVYAAAAFAAAAGSEIDLPTLDRAARGPLAFFPASDTSYVWDTDHWEPESRSTYLYTGGKKNTVLVEVWDGFDWVNSINFIYSYNGSGYLSVYRYQTWQGDAWVDWMRYTNTYTGALVTETLAEQWTGSAWINVSKTIDTYDGSSRLETSTSQSWTGSAWVNSAKHTYTYDGSNDLTLVLSQNWGGSDWLNQTQTISLYDGSHRETSATTQTWNIGLAQWDNQSKDEYEYDGSGNETLDRTSSWVAAAWTVTDVDTMKYNGSDQNIQSVHWNVSLDELSRDDYSYDGSGNLVMNIGYTKVGPDWLPETRLVWVYTSVAVRVDGTELPEDFALLQNHPNPFNPTTTIRYSLGRPNHVSIEIYNALGQLVRVLEDGNQAVGVYETTWDGRNSSGHDAASGVYFYRLKAGDFVQTRKMVLSR